MSRNRRPQGEYGLRRHEDQREAWSWLRAVESRDARNEGRRDLEGGDCASCGWITGRPACPMCGAVIIGNQEAMS